MPGSVGVLGPPFGANPTIDPAIDVQEKHVHRRLFRALRLRTGRARKRRMFSRTNKGDVASERNAMMAESAGAHRLSERRSEM